MVNHVLYDIIPMHRFLLIGFLCICHTQCKILYQCNFDNANITRNCFTNETLIIDGFEIVSADPPSNPWSDVTSSRKLFHFVQ